jgi:uncharacterized OB-fold protein/3-hydroxy-3-methylglutaryl CoA synthase
MRQTRCFVPNLSVCCPAFILSEGVVSAAFGKEILANPPARRITNYDEDVITLAYRAADDCLSDIKEIPDTIIFCSNSLPASAGISFLLASLNLPSSTPVYILGGSWRCALDAWALANLLCSLGKKILLIASEALSRFSLSSPFTPFADGAAAAWIAPSTGSSDSYLFEFESYHSVSDIFEPLVCREESAEIFDDVRFSITKISEVVGSALKQSEKPQSFAFSAFDDRISKAVCRIPQVGKARIVRDPLLQTGFAGCVQPFLLLAQSGLEPGTTVHLAAYGAGASVISLRKGDKSTTDAGSKPIAVKGFEQFREMREFLRKSESMRATFASQAVLSRDQDFLVRLHGTVCTACGRIFTIPQTVCPGCREKDRFVDQPLSRSGTVFTFTHEYYIPTPMPPVTMVVVDLDGGGRITVQATDCSPDQVAIGTRVRLVLRRYHSGAGLPNYYWKAAPV